MHINNTSPQEVQSVTDKTAKMRWVMLVSGVIATVSLVGVLALMFVLGMVLTYIDNKVDAGRIH